MGHTKVQEASLKLCGHKRDVEGYRDIDKISMVSRKSHS